MPIWAETTFEMASEFWWSLDRRWPNEPLSLSWQICALHASLILEQA